MYMLATPHLTPSRYEDVVYHVSRYFAVIDNGTCYMCNPLDGGKVFYICHGVYMLFASLFVGFDVAFVSIYCRFDAAPNFYLSAASCR